MNAGSTSYMSLSSSSCFPQVMWSLWVLGTGGSGVCMVKELGWAFWNTDKSRNYVREPRSNFQSGKSGRREIQEGTWVAGRKTEFRLASSEMRWCKTRFWSNRRGQGSIRFKSRSKVKSEEILFMFLFTSICWFHSGQTRDRPGDRVMVLGWQIVRAWKGFVLSLDKQLNDLL